MRRPWFPRVNWGEASNAIAPGELGDDTEGWYFQIAWLGMLVAFEFGTIARHERVMAEWCEQVCTCQAYPTHCANDCPLHGLEEDYLPVADMIDAAWSHVNGDPQGGVQ
jgi:hypothetical protein